MVALELTIEQAEAALGSFSPGAFVDREALHSFETKLRQAVMVERGASGDHEDMEILAKHLMDKNVRVTTKTGDAYRGRLSHMSGFRSIVVSQGGIRMPVNLSLVAAIEPEEIPV